MHIDVTPMVKPRSVAIVGASAKRVTQGNVVISNLKSWGYAGEILPVHPQAEEIDGLRAINSIGEIRDETDLAIIAIPAAHVPSMLQELEASSVRSAIVFTNGFSHDEEAAIRAFGAQSRIIVHGPNCMGLVNFTDSIPLYPSRPSLRLKPGNVALVAQSGSAAISVMNSTVVGLSKVVTVGSEFQVSAADYIRWLADDDETRVIGVVAESIKSPHALAEAAECVHAAGKSLVVLKVGRSDVGLAATQAHTGALVSDSDAYDSFFRETNIATVSDYDELIASLECAAVARRMVRGASIGIVGISGGQTALACDVADAQGVAVAAFEPATVERLRAALPGTSGNNPVDFGATVNVEDRNTPDAMQAVLNDAQVGAVVALQDTQESLNPATLQNYMNILGVYAAAGKSSQTPLVVISPTSENLDPGVRATLLEHGVPLLRGMSPGLRAVGNLALGKPGPAGSWARQHGPRTSPFNPQATSLRAEIAASPGNTLDAALSFGLLHAYGIPVTRSIVVKDEHEAVARKDEIGFPMVVKVASRDVQHRSDVGGVLLDIGNGDELRAAIATIASNVAKALPNATIDGYELQEQLVDAVEAMAGFTDASPFGQMIVLGSGGTLVELLADRAVALGPLKHDEAQAMLAKTRLHRLLSGYRNLMTPTDTAPLVDVAIHLSELASDLGDVIAACDLNPVLVRKGTGEIRVVDALFVRRS
ncbi:acetate--CoA ligase family protein [Bosea sp. BH3]|uniref:acetate--CoA ligase family protein n=1 Tax=Bosea sp. BH3 TaxID=2871701 RepID=UPI0021CB08C6|nr:acetate--CoA ligase family protein [Bosea sp. BH3]MCU4179643.1 acetate--CoA ligase family protein [Bosea sp. BH3]